MLFEAPAAWGTWLAAHGATSPGVWLRLAKKGTALESVTYQEALDVALCHGWIDGMKRSHDADSWLQKFTPRGPRSIWSKINRARALTLIESERMRPAGLVAIDQAKANGSWEGAYDSHRTATVPEDLQVALNANARAKAFFATLNSQNRYAVLFRIQTAKREETRRKRVQQFVEMLARGEKLYP